VEEKGVEVNLTRIKGKKKEEISDLVARETTFTILLNKKKLVTLNCSPEKYKYLGLGFLYTSGGKHTVKVCLGTACYIRGGKEQLLLLLAIGLINLLGLIKS